MKRINLKLLLSLAIGTLVMVAGVWIAHAVQHQGAGGSLKKEADELAQNGKKEEALKKYRTYLQQNENDVDVYVTVAKLSVAVFDSNPNRGSFQQAFEDLSLGVRHNQDNAELRQLYAEFLMRPIVNRVDDAREQLEWLTSPKRGKHEPKLDLMLAICLVRRVHYDKAMAIYAEMTGYDLKTNRFDLKRARAPAEVEAYVNMAQLMRDNLKPPQPEDADAVMGQLVTVNDKSFRAHLERAHYLHQYLPSGGDASNPEKRKEREALAKTELAAAEKLSPDDANVILYAAQIAQVEKDFDKGESLLKRGLKLFPKNVGMYRQWAILKMDQGKVGEAREKIEVGLGILPKDPNLLWILAEVELQERNLDAAKATLKTLAEIGYPREYLDLMDARILFYQKNWLEASKQFEKLRPLLMQSNEHVKQADLFAAQCYEQLGQYDKQLESCKRVLQIEPSNLAARVGVASALMGLGKIKEAQAAYEELRQIMPPGTPLLYPQVWVPIIELRLADIMKLPEKERDFTPIERLVAWMETNKTASPASIALVKAEVQFRKGDLDAAFNTLDVARNKDPKDAALWTAVATIVVQQPKKGPAAAPALLDQAPADVRDSVTVRLKRAELLLHQGGENVKQAIVALDAGSDKLSPANRAQLWSGLGTSLLTIGDREGATRYWLKVADADPSDLKIRFSLFDVAREIGDEATMSRIQKDMQQIMGPDSVEARYVDAARLVAEVRVLVRDRSGPGHQAMTLDAGEKDKLAAARKLLGQVNQLRPDWYEVARITGDIDLLDGDVNGAIANYQRALKTGPPNPITLKALAMLLMQTRRLAELAPILDQFGDSAVALPGFEKIKIELRMNKGDFVNALQQAEKEVPETSTDPSEQMWVGNLYERAAEKTDRSDPKTAAEWRAKAEAKYRLAVKTGPNSPDTWLALVDNLNANKKRAEAGQVLMDARTKLPEDRVNQVLGPGYEALGEPVLAEQYYRAAIEAAPNDLTSHRLLAMFCMRNGRVPEARKEVVAVLRGAQNAPKEKVNLIWARRAMADILVISGDLEDFKKAKALLIANTKIDDEDSEDRLRLANLLAHRFDEPQTLREALKWFAAVKTPLGSQDKMTLARIHDALGDWEGARSEMLALVSVEKPDPNLFGVFIDMLIRHNQIADADTWLGKLARAQPGAGLLLQAQVRVKQQRPDEAIALLSQILPKRPVPKAKASQLRTVAIVMDQIGLQTAAQELYREYMSYEPGDGSLQLAAFLGRTGRIDEALDLCETAAQTKTLKRDAVMQTVNDVLRSQPKRIEPRHVERVGAWFNRLLKEDPESAALLLQDADFLTIAGQDDKAEKLYRDVLARSDLVATQKAVACNNLAFLLASHRMNLPEALELINRAAAEIGYKSDLLDTRGMVYLAMDKYPEAIADFSEAVLVTSPPAAKFLHLAMAKHLAGDRAGARIDFQRAKDAKLDSTALSKIEQAYYDRLVKDIGQ